MAGVADSLNCHHTFLFQAQSCGCAALYQNDAVKCQSNGWIVKHVKTKSSDSSILDIGAGGCNTKHHQKHAK